MYSHLDPFQTPVEKKVIRDEDPLYTPVLTMHLKIIISAQMPLPPAKNQPWESKQELSITIRIDDQATNMAFNNKVTSFKKKKGHCQTDSFLSPRQG